MEGKNFSIRGRGMAVGYGDWIVKSVLVAHIK